MKDMSTLSDFFGIAGGIVLVYNMYTIFWKSYHFGNIRRIRQKTLLKWADVPPSFQEQWQRSQRELYIGKLLDGNKEEQLNAVNYVKYLDWHQELKRVIKRLICDDGSDEEVQIAAARLLAERLKQP